MDAADRIRLEERAKMLAQASEEVNKMLQKISSSDDKMPKTQGQNKPKTQGQNKPKSQGQNKGNQKNPQQTQRGSKSSTNLSISSTSHPKAMENQKKNTNSQFSNKGSNSQYTSNKGNPKHLSNKGSNPQQFSNKDSNPQHHSSKGYNPQQFANKSSNPRQSSDKGCSPQKFSNKTNNPQQFLNKGNNPQHFSNNINNASANFHGPPPSYNESANRYDPRNCQAMPLFHSPPFYMNQQPVHRPVFPGYHYPQNYVNQPSPLLQFPPATQQQQWQREAQPSNQTQPQPQQQQQTQLPKPLPRKSLMQDKAKNENKPAPLQPDSTSDAPRMDVNMLTRELCNFNGFFTSIETLAKIVGRDYNEVSTVIDNYSKIFSTLKDDSTKKVLVELCPQIKICYHHIGTGCFKPKCFFLHICANFINDKCENKDCSYGHIWKSDHNNRILHNFFIALLPNTMLHSLIKKVQSGEIIPEVCSDYIENKCQNDDDCSKLHICASYVGNLGNCSAGTDCTLNHNIRSAKCTKIFQTFGISTNESPRDLLKILRDRCLGGKHVIESQDNSSKDVSSKQQTSVSDQEDKTRDIKDKKKKEIDSSSELEKNKSVCCWQLHGNVVEPKICIDGIKANCKFISVGCKYLHCKHKSHWQFGEGNTWYNFHLYHSQILDTKYSDASCDDVVLYKLDPKRVQNQQKSLFTLIGDQKCKIDFINMKMDCSGVKKIYSIRNLTTESSVLCSDPESTVFKWYFLDDGGKWILYGGSDSSSSTIEKAYLGKPSGTYQFSSKFVYLLDFSKMTQENLSTNKVRNIKRRPFIPQDTNDGKEKFELPQHWEKMTDIGEHKLVMLSSAHEEYLDIRQRISLTLPMIEIVNVFRIQNAHLWKQFRNKQTELEKKYDDKFLNVQKLFHGIDRKNLNDICRDNLEFRLHDDPSAGKPYGEGTYFYNSAGIAARSSVVDFMGNKTLLVVDVIIGKLAEGSKGLTRPPTNPAYDNALFDTTSDKVDSPTVFVKYNRQEYYPAYVVEFK